LYVAAPLAVKVAVEPGHILGLFTVTVGEGETVTVATAVLVQLAVEPVTVYEVVAPGFTEIVLVVAPVLQLNATGTLVGVLTAVKVTAPPGQVVKLAAVIVAGLFTTTCSVAVVVKVLPSQLVITIDAVYVLVTVGLTATDVEVLKFGAPGPDQVNE
jgi:hypothetical protein